jgi:hypothetical protein
MKILDENYMAANKPLPLGAVYTCARQSEGEEQGHHVSHPCADG